MHPTTISRRALVGAGASFAALRSQVASEQLTANKVIEQIKANVGIPWRPQIFDKIVFGNLETPVRGIATTMMATLAVVQRAAAARRNMVITHEPTFYSHQDETSSLAQDP